MEESVVIAEIKQNVQDKFAELKSAVMMREKLLLRQLEVINKATSQQLQSGNREKQKGKCVGFICENEKELLAAIRNFGRYQLTNLNLALQDVYLKNEDYIKPSDDHETLFKGLNQSIDREELDEENDGEKESIVVDFSRHKSLMEHNAKRINESIINITLKEAKELIMQAKNKNEYPVPPLNLEELDDEVESSIAEVVSSLEQGSVEHSELCFNNKFSQTHHSTKQKRFKPKITINNCNGTINLRNIASLTINCTTDDKVQAQIPVRIHDQEGEDDDGESASLNNKAESNTSQKSRTLVESLISSSPNTDCTSPTSTSNNTTPNSLSNYSSNNSSRSQSTKKPKSKKTKTEKTQNADCKTIKNINKIIEPQDNAIGSSSSSMANEVTCDFYNRLLNEIKKSIDQQQRVRSKSSNINANPQTAQQNSDSSPSFNNHSEKEPQSKRFILKNFENLKIILEANSSGEDESFHPVQIEQWLAEIISDTDLEPMQNTDILEHSNINSEENEET